MSISFLYDPDKVGTVIINRYGNKSILRKYHLTDKEIENCIQRHIEETRDVPLSIKRLAGPYFFNPYRKGIYWSQVQSLYLLGCNRWHNLRDIMRKVEELMTGIIYKDPKTGSESTLWYKFKSKTPKLHIVLSKDRVGRIQENFIFMQRLGCNHPSGYKLRQAYSALDFKKVDKKSFSNGLFYYRLSTYSNQEDAFPIRDFSESTLSIKDSYRRNRRDFLGTIYTNDSIFGLKNKL